jgi:hypothetical protein
MSFRGDARHRARNLEVSARWLTWANGGLQGAVGVITMSIGISTIVATVFA